MYLYLIRHAQPDYEHDSITELGKQQAEKLAQWFSDIKVDELYHSSMGRAGQTASYLAKSLKLDPKSLDWAKELCWGKSNGDAYDPLSPWAIKEKVIQSSHSYPQGESWKTIDEMKNDKIVADIDKHCHALDTFLAEHGYIRQGQLYKAENPNEKTVVLVCHGGVISAFISYLTNTPFFQFISHMGSDLTAVTKIHFRGEPGEYHPAQMIYVNSQMHLGEK